MLDKIKEFKPSSWSIDNRTSIFIITIIITLVGIMAYMNLPKENFPDITLPKVFIRTVYVGASPKDIENLITRPIENQLKAINGLKKVTSRSVQDYSIVIAEFTSEMNVEVAKQKVKDGVDKAKSELPTDLKDDPIITEINFSDLPIMYVNIAGDYDLNKLKRFADQAKDNLEGMKEVSKVDMIGALDRQIQVNVDMVKMQAAGIALGDISRALQYENVSIPGGVVKTNGTQRTLKVSGEFVSVEQMKNLVVNSIYGAPVYLKDIADVTDGFKEQESYARLNHKNVITLAVVKRSGENLIEASDKIVLLVDELKKNSWPNDLTVTLTSDQSERTRTTLHDLMNTIVIGFILVLIILMFFMGTTNAFFVAMSVPLSMCIAFIIMPAIGFTLNMIVLFSFLLALGIVVDDAIVVIENTHRIFDNGKRDIVTAAKMAAGEVFMPVLSGTLTTLAPFVPLAFWTGIIGKFMFFLPITLIITLMASLVVAYIINPVFATTFMKPHEEGKHRNPKKGLMITAIIFTAVALLFYIAGAPGMGNFTILLFLLNLMHRFWLVNVIEKFQTKVWPAFQSRYKIFLTWALKRPWQMMGFTVFTFFLAIALMIIRKPGVIFFPEADPNFVFVYTSLPVGTDQAYTDSITKIIEQRVYKVIGENNPDVTSVIANVGVAVTDPADEDQGYYPNKSKVSVAFTEFGKRTGPKTSIYLDKIREAVKGIPGAEITVAKEQGGPPVGKPVQLEVTGDKFEDLIATSVSLKKYIDSLQVGGVEELKSDLQARKPQLFFNINRERANREGIMTSQIGNEINLAVLGREVSKYRDVNDDYPIVIQYQKDQRNNIDMLKNTKIVYRDMSMGGAIRQVPISAFADVNYSETYGSIKRKNQKRVITLSSNVLNGFNPNDVAKSVQDAVADFPLPSGVTIGYGGAQEEQAATASFLGSAMLISLALIFLILVTQFNSFSKPLIILTEIVFSLIGVFMGFAIFKMELSVLMTGVGVVALAGIVVRNGILLVEFTDLLIEQGMPTFEAIVEAGKTRMTPVILTATATMLGLIPLAVGFNIDFVELFTHFKPHIYFGGDSTAFWGPLSWTMIFGLGFATFLTLILVPVMYLITERIKARVYKRAYPKPAEEVVA